jgi:hypothetical protein
MYELQTYHRSILVMADVARQQDWVALTGNTIDVMEMESKMRHSDREDCPSVLEGRGILWLLN